MPDNWIRLGGSVVCLYFVICGCALALNPRWMVRRGVLLPWPDDLRRELMGSIHPIFLRLVGLVWCLCGLALIGILVESTGLRTVVVGLQRLSVVVVVVGAVGIGAAMAFFNNEKLESWFGIPRWPFRTRPEWNWRVVRLIGLSILATVCLAFGLVYSQAY